MSYKPALFTNRSIPPTSDLELSDESGNRVRAGDVEFDGPAPAPVGPRHTRRPRPP